MPITWSAFVIRTHNAADWQVFEANRDIMPNLRWLPPPLPNRKRDTAPTGSHGSTSPWMTPSGSITIPATTGTANAPSSRTTTPSADPPASLPTRRSPVSTTPPAHVFATDAEVLRSILYCHDCEMNPAICLIVLYIAHIVVSFIFIVFNPQSNIHQSLVHHEILFSLYP